MEKIIDFRKEKEKIEEIDQLAKSIEKMMHMEQFPAHDFFEVRDKKQLAKLIKEYATDDYIELCLLLSEKLLHETDETVISELIWYVFIVANEIADKYMAHFSEVNDVQEYWEYKNCEDKSRSSLIKWNLRIINMINDAKDKQPRIFNGLVYFYAYFVFDFINFSDAV